MVDVVLEAKKVFEIEIEGVEKAKEILGKEFTIIANHIHECKGRVIFMGMGKSGHIARKIAATMASLGIRAFFLHPGEGAHGDLGILAQEDMIVAITNSGETDEILALLPAIKLIGVPLYSIIGRKDSTLEQYSDTVIILPEMKEAFLGNLVPTTSTTVALVMGDALAVAVAKLRGFKSENFALYHPKGTLGRKLTLKVSDLMKKEDENPVILCGTTVKDAIFEMCRKAIGCVNIVNEQKNFLGIFTDGDLKRLLQAKGEHALNEKIEMVMCKNPFITKRNILVIDFIRELDENNKKFSVVPVIECGNIVGTICLSDIVKAGLI